MSSRKQAVLIICLWAMLICAQHAYILLEDQFVPDWYDKFFIVFGPVVVLMEVKQLYEDKHNKR